MTGETKNNNTGNNINHTHTFNGILIKFEIKIRVKDFTPKKFEQVIKDNINKSMDEQKMVYKKKELVFYHKTLIKSNENVIEKF